MDTPVVRPLEFEFEYGGHTGGEAELGSGGHTDDEADLEVRVRWTHR